jgi:hypothetical protein
LLAIALTAVAPAARAGDGPSGEQPAHEQPTRATFALIIGVNTSVDRDTPTLRYADDDAARYVDLFRSLGARTYVLTRPDENTRRLHPQVAAEALLPVRADFNRALAGLVHDVDQAKQRHIATVVYFVYAGHGGARDGRGYITLEDARLDALTLDSEVVDAVGADEMHFIVDACNSYFLALARGPGGQRHEVHGFAEGGGLRPRDNVGLLLSTSSDRESHEWSGVQAGVFSHEVRSALYGAADVDGDGQISYREVSAFVERANDAIPNEQYRPSVYARPPKGRAVLLDLRGRRGSRIEVPGTHAGHYLLENDRGVRIADFHNDASQSTYLLRPRQAGRLYLRRTTDDTEYVVPAEPDVVAVADLTPAEPRARARGAANDSYELLFALPFNRRVVDGFVLHAAPAEDAAASRDSGSSWRFYGGLGLVGAGLAGAAAGWLTLSSARDLHAGLGPAASQAEVADANDRIHAKNVLGGVSLGLGATAAAAGVVMLLWPSAAAHVDAGGSASEARVGIHGTF